MKSNTPEKIAAVGIAWYRREDYRRILEIMEDAAELPATYDEFLAMFARGERMLKAAGRIVVRAQIEPDKFIAWCRHRHMKLDTQARMEFAQEAAYRAVTTR